MTTTPDTLAKLAAPALSLKQIGDAARDAQIAFCLGKYDSFEVALARKVEAALTAQALPAAEPWGAQTFNAPVYPPDGTKSPFTVINLGLGKVQMGDSIHDHRLPALWFGTNGQGMGHEEIMNREAKPGETLAVVTFANVEGLDVLLEAVQRIRRESFPQAAQQAAQATAGWVLVPIEPTDAMLDAGKRETHSNKGAREKTLRIYRAMLAAALPQPQPQSAQEDA